MFKLLFGKTADAEVTVGEGFASAVFNRRSDDNCLELVYTPDFALTGGEYVLFPACCYDGNRFDVLKKSYPPFFAAGECGVDMPITITDVPRLNRDGGGSIQVTTGDVSVPCVGVFSPGKRRAALLYTVQELDGINLGLAFQNGQISITYPHMRKEELYRWPFMRDGRDSGLDFEEGRAVTIPYRLLTFDCPDMETFYEVFFANRKCMGMEDARPKAIPFDRQFAIQRDKFNLMNWRETGGFYGVTTGEDGPAWQPGWVGGAMSSYALMKLGGPLEWERGIRTLHHLFNTQAPSGFFYESSDGDGTVSQTMFGAAGTADFHLLRKSADCLYFIFKHFELMRERKAEIPLRMLDGAKRLADAFVTLWERYGQLGQFVNIVTGDILAGGSTSAGIAPAGLTSAYRWFADPRYLRVASESAEQYYTRDARAGYTTGGPGEILQCPDSESAAGLLESLVELYDLTGEEKWLRYAKHTAHLCASWVVPYNYRFPPQSEFGRLGMRTVGSVFANAQNKHSAPGICTLSGDSLYRLYRWTGNEAYLELLRDIALTISQYMSTDERPIYSWDVPKDASLLGDDSVTAERERLPSGFICERVNLSDWESERCVGGVFNGSCWPEVTNLLVLAEVAGLPGLSARQPRN